MGGSAGLCRGLWGGQAEAVVARLPALCGSAVGAEGALLPQADARKLLASACCLHRSADSWSRSQAWMIRID
jgi:hypothetical protein